jgi:hypothetical protein
VIKQETVIQGGEDSLDSLLQGQIRKGHRDPFLEQRFISFKGNARLSFDIPGYTYQRGLLEVYGQASALNAHALGPESRRHQQKAAQDPQESYDESLHDFILTGFLTECIK